MRKGHPGPSWALKPLVERLPCRLGAFQNSTQEPWIRQQRNSYLFWPGLLITRTRTPNMEMWGPQTSHFFQLKRYGKMVQIPPRCGASMREPWLVAWPEVATSATATSNSKTFTLKSWVHTCDLAIHTIFKHLTTVYTMSESTFEFGTPKAQLSMRLVDPFEAQVFRIPIPLNHNKAEAFCDLKPSRCMKHLFILIATHVSKICLRKTVINLYESQFQTIRGNLLNEGHSSSKMLQYASIGQ